MREKIFKRRVYRSTFSSIGFCILCLLLPACGEEIMNSEKNINLNTLVKYQLDNTRYAVPLGFHWDAYIKHNQWPTPRGEYTKVESMEFTALLPDLAPYSELTRNEFEARGHGKKLDVLIQSRHLRPKPLPEIIEQLRQQNRLVTLTQDMNGLSHYADTKLNDDEDEWEDLYVASNVKKNFWIRCARDVPFPSCKVTVAGSEAHYITYHYSREFLSDWQMIDNKLTRLLRSFQISNANKP